jgi:hypothetical protein
MHLLGIGQLSGIFGDGSMNQMTNNELAAIQMQHAYDNVRRAYENPVAQQPCIMHIDEAVSESEIKNNRNKKLLLLMR